MPIIQIVPLLVMGLIGYGLGRKIWRLLGVGFNSFLEEIVFSLALGWGALAYLVLGLGLGGLLYPLVAYGLVGLLMLIALPELRTLFRTIRKDPIPPFVSGVNYTQEERECPSRILSFALWTLLALTLVTALIGALAPPLNYDTLSYHLAFPLEFIRRGAIVYLPYQVYSNFPFTLQMLYLLSLLLRGVAGGEILAKLIHLSFGLLTAVAIYSFARHYFNSRTALLSAVIFFNIPLVGFLSTTAFDDLGVTLYGFLALYGGINWFYSRKRQDLLVCALFTGLAMGATYSAILFSFFPLLLGIILKMSLIDKRRWPGIFKKAFIFSLIAVGVFSPWLIRNLINTGNPVYPLFYNLLGGRSWNEFNALRFMKHHTAPFHYWWEVFLVPLTVGRSIEIGPLFVVFAPLIIFFKRFSGVSKLLLAYGGIYFLLWAFFTHRVDRFLLPAFPVFSLVAAYLMMRFRKEKVYSLLLMAGLALALALNYQRFHLLGLHLLYFREGMLILPLSLGLSALIIFLAINCVKTKSLSALIGMGLGIVMLVNLSAVVIMIPKYGLLRVALGRESREEFLSRTWPAFDAFHFANENLPLEAKVLFIGENQRFFLDRDFLGNSPLDNNRIVEIANVSHNAGEIRDRLKEIGVTHILYNVSEVRRVTRFYDSFNWADEEARKRFYDFFLGEEYLELMFLSRGVSIHEVL